MEDARERIRTILNDDIVSLSAPDLKEEEQAHIKALPRLYTDPTSTYVLVLWANHDEIPQAPVASSVITCF